jgi:hypothetical protein
LKTAASYKKGYRRLEPEAGNFPVQFPEEKETAIIRNYPAGMTLIS